MGHNMDLHIHYTQCSLPCATNNDRDDDVVVSVRSNAVGNNFECCDRLQMRYESVLLLLMLMRGCCADAQQTSSTS